MKKFAAFILAIVFILSVSACGREPIFKEENNSETIALTEKEIEYFNKKFDAYNTVFSLNNIGTLYWSCFFTSYYSDIKEIDFEEFLRYFPASRRCRDEKEFDALKETDAWHFKTVENLEDMIVPVSKYSKKRVDSVLKKCAGITTEDIDISDVPFLEEYNSFYNYTSDFGPGKFVCTKGERKGNFIYLYEETEEGTDRLTLYKENGSYKIIAHEKIA